jgi:hypothetical protein
MRTRQFFPRISEVNVPTLWLPESHSEGSTAEIERVPASLCISEGLAVDTVGAGLRVGVNQLVYADAAVADIFSTPSSVLASGGSVTIGTSFVHRLSSVVLLTARQLICLDHHSVQLPGSAL